MLYWVQILAKSLEEKEPRKRPLRWTDKMKDEANEYAEYFATEHERMWGVHSGHKSLI